MKPKRGHSVARVPTEADQVAVTAVVHALDAPFERDRWIVATDAAHEASWTTVGALDVMADALRGRCLLMFDFAKIEGTERDDDTVPLRLYKVWKDGRRALFCLQPEDLLPEAAWLPAFFRRSVQGPPNIYGKQRRPWMPRGGPFVRSGRTEFVGFEACTVEPGETVTMRRVLSERIQVVQWFVSTACADQLMVDDIRVGGDSLLMGNIPAVLLTADSVRHLTGMTVVVEANECIEFVLVHIGNRTVNASLGVYVHTEAESSRYCTVGGAKVLGAPDWVWPSGMGTGQGWKFPPF